ncbi:hypothetical protein Y032_0258g459 [Ancylostoma ceylanicum]|uniref:Uncharacterized protein n=1 Tax=Ancylostoma ceylanicum TaxID=53326 RepID=A0A016SBH2_9BILA|nr:hypothetical protein Y032_0258g459 [Ancylostoma ceylanicum]
MQRRRVCEVDDLTQLHHSSAACGAPTASAAPSLRRSARSDAFYTAVYYFINTCSYRIFSSSHKLSHKKKDRRGWNRPIS